MEIQDCEECIKSNKTIILAIIMFVTNNTLRYKEHDIIVFDFEEVVYVIDWLENMKVYV